MAWQVIQQAVTIPAGTLESAPQTTDLNIGVWTVEAIRWRVPPGPNGNVGWNLSMAGTTVIPAAGQNWIIANDESDTWELENLIDSGAWQFVGYNTGTNDHTVYVAFLVTPIGIASPVPQVNLFAPSQLAGVA
jgi:hypothetical protein